MTQTRSPEPIPGPTRTPGVRPDVDPHPDHHLWVNGRVWWVACMLQDREGTRLRIRRSLGTHDREVARRRRDALLERASRLPGWRLELRFAPRREPAVVSPAPVATDGGAR